MNALYETHRPKSWAEVVGQRAAVSQVRRIGRKGFGGRAFWLCGASGTGKTTIAKLIAREVAEDWFIEEYDSGEAFTLEVFETIERSIHLYGGGKGGRAYIINEAHGLRVWMIRRLLGLLERIPNHVVFIFTTTKAGQTGLFEQQVDAGPLMSRCIYIALKNDKHVARAFAERSYQIARTEHLNGQRLERYMALATECKNNLRDMLQRIEAGQTS